MKYEGNVYTKAGIIRKGIVNCDAGVITDINLFEEVEADASLLDEGLIIPGLVDMHLHGACGYDICDGTKEAFDKIASYENENGIVAFCGATMTVSYDELEKIGAVAANYPSDFFKGIYLEGPFISEKYSGAQKKEFIKKASINDFNKIARNFADKIKVLVVASEEIADEAFIEYVTSNGIRCSLGHTAADYECALNAFDKGASQVTHLYNAMQDIGKRNPGVIGAAFERKAYVELIADGNHISDTVIKMAFSTFDSDKLILVSDSMRGTGLPDGEYTLGGQKVFVRSKAARLVDGTLAGSVTNLRDCLINVIRMGISVNKAIDAATINPARSLGIDEFYGSIEVGKCHPIIL